MGWCGYNGLPESPVGLLRNRSGPLDPGGPAGLARGPARRVVIGRVIAAHGSVGTALPDRSGARSPRAHLDRKE